MLFYKKEMGLQEKQAIYLIKTNHNRIRQNNQQTTNNKTV